MSTTDRHECPNTAAVAGLARELEAVRRNVGRLETLRRDIDRLSGLVQQLVDQVEAASPSSIPVVAPTWLDLPEHHRGTVDLLGDLIDWLGGVFLRYADAAQALPECWLWHPDVVEELVWLMYAWRAAYRDDKAAVQLAGDWHDRHRPGVVRRIREQARNCSLDNHTPRSGRPSGARPTVPLAEAIEHIAAWWAARRHDPPPEPTVEQLHQVAAREGGRS